jgi:hypothetical protein
MNPVISYLQAEVALIKTMRSVPNLNGYCSMGDFILRNQKVLPFQPCKGALGFFRPKL